MSMDRAHSDLRNASQSHAKKAGANANGPFRPDEVFPRPILIAAAFIVLLTLGGSLISSRTGIGTFETPVLANSMSRAITFRDVPGNMVEILDDESGKVLHRYDPVSGGFVVEALRNLERQRGREGFAASEPFIVALKSDGRLTLEDPSTDANVELRAFGEVNARAFLDILLDKSENGTETEVSS